MNNKNKKKLKEFRSYIKNIEYMKITLNSLLYWDKISKMPSKGIDFRSEVMSYFASEIYKYTNSDILMNYIEYFEDVEDLDEMTKSMIRRLKRNREYVNRIPADEYKEYIALITKAEGVWQMCKEKNDFNTFAPYLEKICNHFKNFAEYWGYEEDPYDALIGYYEPGITVGKVDGVVKELRDFIIDLLKKIEENGCEIDEYIFRGYFPKEAQEKLSLDILKTIGFDLEAGRLDESVHTMTLANSNKDVRITTYYDEKDFRPAMFTAFHEGGHGIYEQDISSKLYGTFLAEASSMGVHESEARFYENIVGKSLNFWSYYYDRFKKFFPSFNEVSLERFCKGINKVKPSLIRMDADELTYSLHIIIRYEIEKDLINEEITVKDLPKIWNEKYSEYLGIRPPNNALGVLQDVHWAAGYWGYFPSYVLGNLYGAQFFYKMKKDMPDFDKNLRSGKLDKVHEWLKENIHKYGALYDPDELIINVTREKLSAKYYINYLKEKYYKIYNLF